MSEHEWGVDLLWQRQFTLTCEQQHGKVINLARDGLQHTQSEILSFLLYYANRRRITHSCTNQGTQLRLSSVVMVPSFQEPPILSFCHLEY